MTNENQLFWQSVTQLPHNSKYIHECFFFCELVGSIILSACLLWGW